MKQGQNFFSILGLRLALELGREEMVQSFAEQLISINAHEAHICAQKIIK